MLARDVPKCFRGSVALADAYTQGCAAGRAGVAAEGNPWLENGPRYAVAFSEGDAVHAATPSSIMRNVSTRCGFFPVSLTNRSFNPDLPRACKRCIRAVEAERKRLAESWESGRLSAHPK